MGVTEQFTLEFSEKVESEARGGELPKHWEVKKLGEVADYLNGRAFKPSEWEQVGKPIIRIQNLNKPDAN
jgi:restriction endonuclease S subunit